jgi:hypothetical protein
MPNDKLETISSEQLLRANGGVQMKLTQYGYPHDPYSDRDTRAGRGAYHHLERNESIALTDSGLRALGLSRSQVRHGSFFADIHLRGGGTMTRRIDDRAPERDKRVDLYQPGGFDRHLGDHADVTLHHK